MHPIRRLIALATFCLTLGLPAQESGTPEARPLAQLEIERHLRERLLDPGATPDIDLIMLGDEYSGTHPERVRFALDGKSVIFRWRRRITEASARPEEVADWRYEIATGALECQPDDAEPPFTADDAEWNEAGTRAVLERSGDLYLVEGGGTLEPRALLRTAEAERFQGFAADGRRILFSRGDEVFLLDPDQAAITQLTRFGKDPDLEKPEKKEPAREALARDQRELLRIVDQRLEDAEKAKERDRLRRAREPRPFAAPKDHRIQSVRPSPALDRCLVVVAEQKKPVDTLVPNYVTDDGYVSTQKARPKVGESMARSRLFEIRLETGESREIALPSGERPCFVRGPRFSADGRRAAVVVQTADSKDAWLLAVEEGGVRVLQAVHDDAWLRHFCDDWGFIPGADALWFTSEQTGFTHLYRFDLAEDRPKALTEGRWLIDGVELHRGLGRFVVTGSEVSPYQRQVTLIDLDGSTRSPLTSLEGFHEVRLSPDGGWIADVWSRSNRPWELHLRERGAAEPGLQVTKSPSPAFEGRTWPIPEIVEVTARDGAKVPMRLYRPPHAAAGGPAVVFVHGAGYLQNVHRRWSSYSREYLFNSLLAEAGYHVIDVDYRGSAGYGRDWRVGIYRHMGGKDLDDQVDCVRWLVENAGVDPARVGIYGGSYGGFITLMGLFTRPEVFAAGAALRPVTDWAHYNHGYTSQILNLPQDDAEAFRISSPIRFAEGLRGKLLICHGVVDDNVQFQDVMRLTQRLIELRKENWELAAYPVEPHGFRDPASWADEYRRIRALFRGALGL